MVKTINAIYEDIIPTIKSSQGATNCAEFIHFDDSPNLLSSFSYSRMFAELRGVVGFKIYFKVIGGKLIYGN